MAQTQTTDGACCLSSAPPETWCTNSWTYNMLTPAQSRIPPKTAPMFAAPCRGPTRPPTLGSKSSGLPCGQTSMTLRTLVNSSSAWKFFSCDAPMLVLVRLRFCCEGVGRKKGEVLLADQKILPPVLIGSPFDFGAANLDATALRARMLASKVKSLLPSTLQTPGGTVKYSAGSPLANIHAVIGQGALTSLFATIWSCLGQKPEPSDMQLHQTSHSPFMQTPNGVSPPPDVHMTSLSQGSVGSVPHSSTFRSRKLKLSHLPVESLPSSLDLLPGFQTRLASEKDDIKTIGRLFRDFRKALAPKGHFVNLDQSLIEARKALAENRLWIYSVYSTTCEGLSLIAGYLTVGAETDQSIAITELFTHSDYRKRNVAESLVRAVTIHYLDRAPVPKRQVVCLIPDAFDAATRVFARVGFRLGEQSRLESTLTGVSQISPVVEDRAARLTPFLQHEEGVKVKKGEVAPPEYSYLSWERWHEVRFESIEQGTSWHSTTV